MEKGAKSEFPPGGLAPTEGAGFRLKNRHVGCFFGGHIGFLFRTASAAPAVLGKVHAVPFPNARVMISAVV